MWEKKLASWKWMKMDENGQYLKPLTLNLRNLAFQITARKRAKQAFPQAPSGNKSWIHTILPSGKHRKRLAKSMGEPQEHDAKMLGLPHQWQRLQEGNSNVSHVIDCSLNYFHHSVDRRFWSTSNMKQPSFINVHGLRLILNSNSTSFFQKNDPIGLAQIWTHISYRNHCFIPNVLRLSKSGTLGSPLGSPAHIDQYSHDHRGWTPARIRWSTSWNHWNLFLTWHEPVFFMNFDYFLPCFLGYFWVNDVN